MNLIENARRAVGPGVGCKNLDEDVGALVQIEVTDSGRGVPIALRERIFEAFFTTKDPGIGTGLGLPVSRAIVQRHGGVQQIHDCEGRSAFVIELPVASAPARFCGGGQYERAATTVSPCAVPPWVRSRVGSVLRCCTTEITEISTVV